MRRGILDAALRIHAFDSDESTARNELRGDGEAFWRYTRGERDWIGMGVCSISCVTFLVVRYRCILFT